jgi:hypothetical protein
MSQWQIMKKGVAEPIQFDDGVWAAPGEDGFTTEYVVAEVQARKADGYSYIGRTTQVVARTEAAIAPRVAEATAALTEEVIRQKTAEILAAAPKGKARSAADARDEATKYANTQAATISAAARAHVLKDMGLAER